MLDLLKNYSLSEIVVFIIILALAIKSLVTFFDWALARIRKPIDKEYEKEKEKNAVSQQLEEHNQKIEFLATTQKEIQTNMSNLSEAIDLLIRSDRDDIKAWITEKHHHFCYKLGYIDDYSLDCIEKRYVHYVDEKGNSFIKALMDEIRALPKVSVIKEEEKK